MAGAVAIGALIGPSAVGARVVESFAGHRYHPVWTMIASATLVAVGVLMFLFRFRSTSLAVALYAVGNGIGSSNRIGIGPHFGRRKGESFEGPKSAMSGVRNYPR